MRRALILPVIALALGACGCNILGPAMYFLRPPQIQKPVYKFPSGSRVAVVVEAARPEYENPLFAQTLVDRTLEYLERGKWGGTLVPLSATYDLRSRAEYPTWSMQRIGRELSADYVLYMRIELLGTRESPLTPVLAPRTELRMRVIEVAAPASHARVWPAEPEGHLVRCNRQVIEASEAGDEDTELVKLARDAAYWTSMPFISVDLEEPTPVEP